jgi:hypothetical protein
MPAIAPEYVKPVLRDFANAAHSLRRIRFVPRVSLASRYQFTVSNRGAAGLLVCTTPDTPCSIECSQSSRLV